MIQWLDFNFHRLDMSDETRDTFLRLRDNETNEKWGTEKTVERVGSSVLQSEVSVSLVGVSD